ncbi:hypothetical protein [Frankia sp. AvcI1]|uniref:hypothetical protein n=1 Tax=Frankia sp. AvcI1 TaxID=573496 RepID=UPI000B1420FA|nr:hypothetical protein [Frankia sp. AvcI1]
MTSPTQPRGQLGPVDPVGSVGSVGPFCPVCELAIPPVLPGQAGEQRCDGCGWTLRGPVLLGPLTPEVTAAFDRRLGAASRGYDLGAAARVLAAFGDAEPGLADELGRAVRAGPPAPGELEAARAELAAAARAAGRGARPRGPTLTTALLGLVGRMGRAGLGGGVRPGVAEVTADAVTLSVVEVDELGLPVARELVRRDWAELLPGLPSDRPTRLLRLAGGVGPVGAVPSAAVGAVTGALSAAGVTDVVVAWRLDDGWPPLERFAEALAEPGALRANVTWCRAWPGESPAAVLAQAPLPTGYGLVVAEVAQGSRNVRLTTVPLFDAGLVVGPNGTPSVEVTVGAPRGGFELALVVVARPGGTTDPAAWRPVAIGRCVAAPGSTLPVRVALEGPRTVRFLEPPGTRSEQVPPGGSAGPDSPLAASWRELRDGQPSTYGAEPLDLVLLVETGGLPRTVAARLSLAERLLELVGREHPEPEAVRVSVIGYADHDVLDPLRAGQPVVRSVIARAPAEAAGAPQGWRTPHVTDVAAPIEDALHTALDLPWRPDAYGVLITIGARGPHPPTKRGDTSLANECEFGHDWERLLRRLVERVDPVRIAARGGLDFVPTERSSEDVGRAERAWAALGEHGQLPAGAGYRELAELAELLEDGPAGAGRRGRALAVPLLTPTPPPSAGTEPVSNRSRRSRSTGTAGLTGATGPAGSGWRVP